MSPPKSQPQHDRFLETARAIGADEDMEAFRAKLGVIARQKPKDESNTPPAVKGENVDG